MNPVLTSGFHAGMTTVILSELVVNFQDVLTDIGKGFGYIQIPCLNLWL